VLNRKADEVQRGFLKLNDDIEGLNAEILNLKGDARSRAVAQQREMRAQQQKIAEEINLWRERARSVTQTGGPQGLKALLAELKALDDPSISSAVDRTLMAIESPEAAAEAFAREDGSNDPQTPVGRFLARAHNEYDLRVGDPSNRIRAASEFANRPGMAQSDEVQAELRAAEKDPDPLVRELVSMTLIQLHRFRALRFADLDLARESVQELARSKDRYVVPVLAEILQSPRTGFQNSEQDEPVEAPNTRSRMVALLRLVEWHTGEAQAAVRSVQYDREGEIGRAAQRALEVFPDIWTGPLKKSKGG
jgi:hypothetical protein